MGVRQGMLDLGQGLGGGGGQVLVARCLDQAGAQRQCVELFVGEGERRQVETGPQHIAHPGLAVDRRPGGDEMGDIAIDGAFRHFETLAHVMSCHGPGGGFPQGLDDPDETFGPPH